MPRCPCCRVPVAYSSAPDNAVDSEDCLGNTFPFPEQRLQWIVGPVTFSTALFMLG